MKKWTLLVLFAVFALMAVPLAMAQNETPAAVEEEEVLDIVSGKVVALDAAANKLTVTDADAKAQEFTLDPNLTTVWDDASDEEKEISDLAVGKSVVVEYRVDEAGKKIASWIDIVPAEEKAPEAPAKPAAPAVEAPVTK